MKNKLLFLFLTVSVFSFAQNCSELFISEYVEGWANNKAIEIYNPTDTAINLSDYFISRFANGSTQTTVANAVQLSGIVQAHDVYVAVLDKRNPLGTGQEAPIWDSLEVKADGFYCPVFQTNNAFYWNGNDAVVLAKGLATDPMNAQVVDIFGKIGEDPGIGWSTDFPYTGAGVIVTADHSMLRKASILKGETNSTISFFNPLAEYDSIPPVIVRLDLNGDTIFGISGNPILDGNWNSLGFHNCLCNSTTICDSIVLSQTLNVSSCATYMSPTNQSYSQSGVYNEVILNEYGCDSVNLTINLTILNSSLSFTTAICDGDSYTWNGQQYIQQGTYAQTFTNQFGCDSIVTLNLIVNENSPIQIQANPTFGNAPLNVLFNNQTTNLSNYNFTWNFGDGTSQQSNSPFLSHTYTQNGYADVTVFAENTVTGCITSAIFNDMIFVQGGVVCTHTATLNQTGPLNACTGDSVLLSCNTDPSFSYQWNRNGVPVSGATSSSIYAQLSGSYTVTIYQNTCPVTSNGISVTINPLPSIPTITSTGTITSCFGGALTLSVPAGSSSYSWNTGATTASISVTQSGSYTVTVTNSNGCARTSAPYVVNASFMASPNVCVVGMDSLTNENRIVWEKPLTLGIDSFYVYKETNVSDVYTKIGATNYPDLAVFLDQNSNPAVQAYRYKLTVLDTCGTETLLSDFHKTIHLTINAGVGGAWNLIWSHYEGLTFGSYNIYRGTDPTNISLLTTIQSNLNSYTDLAPPVGPVYYQIEIVNPNSCDPTKVINYSVSRSNIVNNGVNGLNTPANSTVLVYPNPTSKDVTLEITAELIEKDYYLTDNTGRIILSGQFRALKETINLEQISTGVYFIKIDDNAHLMYKIVKD
jgi:hypothetical protein